MDIENSHTITARGLTKRFGSFTAVDEINFEVNRGEIFGLLGPNGSGKTTTIRMTLGLLRRTKGEIKVLGVDVGKSPAKIRPQVGYMSQRFSLYNDLTVLQNLQFYGKAYGLKNTILKERIESALVMAGLEGRENALTRELSGGWRQRLALSAAILHRPKVIFLDEPTAGVDPISRRVLWDLLYQLVAEKITIFVTTHYMDEAEHCHRLAFIQHGKIIAYGTPAAIKKSTMNGEVLEIAPSDAVRAMKILRDAAAGGALSIAEVELYGSLVHVVAPEIEKLKAKISSILQSAGVDPGEMSIIEPSLEDVFIASMKNNGANHENI